MVIRCSHRMASALADVRTPGGRVRLLGVCEIGPLRLELVKRGLSPERAHALSKGVAKKRAVAQVKAQARALAEDETMRKALERPGLPPRDMTIRKAPPDIAQELAAEPGVTSGSWPLAALAGALLPAPWPWNWHPRGVHDSGTNALLSSFAPGPTIRRGLLEYRP